MHKILSKFLLAFLLISLMSCERIKQITTNIITGVFNFGFEDVIYITSTDEISEKTHLQLSQKLGVTASALYSFFAILQTNRISQEQLDATLNLIVKHYKESLDKLNRIKSDSPIVQSLLSQSSIALKEGELTQTEDLLYQAFTQEKKESSNQKSINLSLLKAALADLKLVHLNYTDGLQEYIAALDLLPTEKSKQKLEFYIQLGDLTYSIGKYKDSIKYLQKALDIKAKKNEQATILTKLGRSYLGENNIEKSKKCLQEANGIMEELSTNKKEQKEFADNYFSIGTIYNDIGDCKTAISFFEKAMLYIDSKEKDGKIEIAKNYSSIGSCHYILKNQKQALEALEKSNDLNEKVYGKVHPNIAINLHQMGNVYFSEKKFKTAISYYKQAIDILNSVFGESNTNLGVSYYSLGLAYFELKDYDNALESFRKSLNVKYANLADNHPDIANGLSHIGQVYNAKKEYEKSAEFYNHAIEAYLKSEYSKSEGLANTYLDVGVVYLSLKEPKKAVESYQKALKIKKEIYKENEEIAQIYTTLADIQLTIDDKKNAKKNYGEALKILKKVADKNNPNVQIVEKKYNSI